MLRAFAPLAFALVLFTGCFGSSPDSIAGRYTAIERVIGDIPSLPPHDVNGRADVVLVDVREAEEIAVSRITGALTAAEYDSRRVELRGRTVVAYCTIGYRSASWVKAERESNPNVYNLEGGVLAWAHAGLTFEDDGAATHNVHVYSRTWNIPADGYHFTW